MFSPAQIVTVIVLILLFGIGVWVYIRLNLRDDAIIYTTQSDDYDDDDCDDDDYNDDDDYEFERLEADAVAATAEQRTGEMVAADFKTIAHAATEIVVPHYETDTIYRALLDRALRPHLYEPDWYETTRKDFSAWAAEQWAECREWKLEDAA